MTTAVKSAIDSKQIMWVGVGLALLAALAYVLIGLGVLTVGDIKAEEGSGNITYIAAVCYTLGGLLILIRRRGLWIIGLVINTLVLMFFFQMYQNRPVVVFSPGGLATKAAQILLEISLLYLILTDWRKSRR